MDLTVIRPPYRMLAEWYLRKQLAALPESGAFKDLESLVALAGMCRLVFASLELFRSEQPVISSYFAVQDQTYDTRQRVLQIAGSLAKGSQKPLFKAVVQAAREAGLPLREVDADALPENGLIGRLERTWYVLGDYQAMQAEAVELGVTSQALAQQLESAGLHTIFLAQKQPKRLLAIFGFDYPLRLGAEEAAGLLQSLGLELVVLTGERAGIAKGVGTRLGIPLIQSELSPDEKRSLIASLVEQVAGTGVIGSVQPKSAGLRISVGPSGKRSADVSVADLPALAGLIGSAREVVERTKSRFFWSNV